ncbi:MAG: cyclic nucleotide-binding domain-containing protein [Desulfobacteraceae bacterium]|nr:MAG: cyclic nucleotide-binding domain-containing protein [Desulfobacteraceae bacterium]
MPVNTTLLEAVMNNDITDDILAQMGITLPAQEVPRDEKEILDTLHRMPNLKGLSESDFKGILPLSKIRKFKAGDEVIKEGQFDNWIFFIMSGRFAIVKKGETIGVLEEYGDIFGEMCIIDGSPRSASIKALDDSVCLAVDASYTDNLKGQAKIYFQCILYHVFSQLLVERLRKINEDLVKTKDENASLKEEIRKIKSSN